MDNCEHKWEHIWQSRVSCSKCHAKIVVEQLIRELEQAQRIIPLAQAVVDAPYDDNLNALAEHLVD
jgi:hypothetical protein